MQVKFLLVTVGICLGLLSETSGALANPYSTTRTWTRNGNSVNLNTVYRLPNGSSSNRNTTWTSTGSGGYTGSSTYTNPQGVARTSTFNGQVTFNNGTLQNSATITRPNGNSVQYLYRGPCGNGQCSRTRTWSSPNRGL